MERSCKKKHVLAYVILLCSVVSQHLAAEYQITAFTDIRFSDNGTRVGANADKVNETITELGVNFSADTAGSFYSAKAGYDFAKTVFAQDTQVDRNFITGNGSLLLGTDSSTFSLDLNHSRQLATIQTFQASNLDNTEERDIATAAPSMRLRLSPTDNIVLRATYSETIYTRPDELEEANLGVNLRPDSTLFGQSFSWTHALSRISSFGLDASRSESDIEGAADFTFEYQQVQFNYASTLRLLTYNLSAGYNQATFLSEEFSSPSYDIEVTYEDGAHTFALSFVSTITETSQGNGNRQSIGGDLGLNSPVGRDNAAAGIVDTYKSRISEGSYALEVIPGRLTLEAFVGSETSRFQIDEESNYDSVYSRLRANYLVGRRAELTYDYGWWELEPEFDEDQGGAKNTSHRVTYAQTVSEQLDFSVFYIRDEWDTPGSDVVVYTENLVGASVNYSFF